MRTIKKIVIKQSIFTKLCIVFFAVVFILFIIGYSIYNWGIRIIQNEIIFEACIQNKNFSDSLNSEFKRIIMLQYEMADNWDLTRLSTSLASNYNDYEKSLMILRIKEKINAIKTSSRLIEEIKVIVPYINKSIETVTTRDIQKDSMILINSYANMKNKQILYYNNELLLISEYPQIYYKRGLLPDFLIHTSISKNNLNQFLNEMSMYRESKGFVFSESRNMTISSDNDETTQSIQKAIHNKKGKEVMNDAISIDNTYVLYEKINGIRYIIVYTDTDLADIKLVRYVSEKAAFQGLSKYRVIMWVFAIAAVISIILFSKSLYGIIHSPLKKLVKAFEKVQNADFTVAINHSGKDEFKYIYEGFNKMVLELNNLIEQVYKQKILVEKAKLKQLQVQINPHFLYNSFIILSNRIQVGDNDFAAEFCREIGSYFMFITRNKQDIVPLKYEVEHAVTYSKIQYARFYNRMRMDLDELPDEYENIMVPRLILQPIIENSFEHTIENMESGGYLHMGYFAHGEYLDIAIEDNGTDLGDEKINYLKNYLDDKDSEVTGMINIHQRLKLVYSDECGIIIGRSKFGGLKVTIRISINYNEVNENV